MTVKDAVDRRVEKSRRKSQVFLFHQFSFSFSQFVKMVCCSAPGCTNHSNSAPKGVSFHTFPLADPVRMGKWLSMMRRDNFVPKSGSRLCSEHFTDDCFERSLKSELSVEVGYKRAPKRRLLPDAVPTIFSHVHNLAMNPHVEARPLSSWQRRRASMERSQVRVPTVNYC